jgi:hypothetical protein
MQENVKNISHPSCRKRHCTGVKFLCSPLGATVASELRHYGMSEFHVAANLGFDHSIERF